MKAGNEIEEEINSSTKGRQVRHLTVPVAAIGQAARTQFALHQPRHTLPFVCWDCHWEHVRRSTLVGGVLKSLRNHATLLLLPDTMHSLKDKPWDKALLL